MNMALRAQAELELRRRRQAEGTDILPLLAWTQRHRRMLDSSTPFDIDNHRYLKGIYEDTNPERVINKSGQGGASEYAISTAMHACDQRGMDVLYLLPTIGDISDFSQMRIGTALEASPYLATRVAQTDRVQLKRVRDKHLVLRGAQVTNSQASGQRRGASRLKAVPADLVIYDEFDEMPPGVEALAQKRLGHSQYKEQLFISTPTYPGIGIDAKWQESDQRLWHILCPSCDHRQHLTIDHIVLEWDDLERPKIWHGQSEDRACCACERCGKELDRLAEGEWVPTYPERDLAGYSFNKLVTAQTEPLAVVQALMTTDIWLRQEAFNQDLALPFHPQGGGLTDAELDAVRRQYIHAKPQPNERGNVMGVDVGRVLHVVIRGPVTQTTGERQQRLATEVATFEDVGRLIRQYKISRCVMDALPETHKAREFQEDFIKKVWLAYFGPEISKRGELATWKEEGGKRGEPWAGTVTIDRTRAFDELQSVFIDNTWTLPQNARDIPDYYAHLKAPVRVINRQPNRPDVARYVSSGPDHYALAELYALTATYAPRGAHTGVLVQSKVKGW